MSFSTYSAFRTSVSTWVDVSDLTTAQLDDLITVAEARVYNEVRHRSMESALSLTIASGVAAVPSDYIDLKHAYISAAKVQWLDRKSPEWIYRNYPVRSGANTPGYIAREGSNFIFAPYPANNTVLGIYYAKPAALSSALSSLFTAYPSLFLFAANAEVEGFLGRTNRFQLWDAKYGQMRDLVNSELEEENNSGSNLAVTAE